MEQYRLIGYPLGHSLSPQIHRKLFELESRCADYELFAFEPAEFETNLPALRALNGFNITIPYKQTIIPFLDSLEERAQLYGSVNTVHNVNGRCIGYNTDCDGFLHTMSSHGIALDTRVCILGAGGVGRMFAIECARQGADVTLAVRPGSRAKAQALAAEILQKAEARASVITLDATASTTPPKRCCCGMRGKRAKKRSGGWICWYGRLRPRIRFGTGAPSAPP